MLSSHPKRGHNPNLIGIVAMVLAAAMFTLVDVMLKLLVAHYPPWQVVGMRGLVSLPVLAWWIHRRGAWPTLVRIRFPLQLFRGLLAVGMLLCLTLGFRDLPLANAYTLYFIAPLLMTLMSAPVLGERVTAVHWWAVVGGALWGHHRHATRGGGFRQLGRAVHRRCSPVLRRDGRAHAARQSHRFQ